MNYAYSSVAAWNVSIQHRKSATFVVFSFRVTRLHATDRQTYKRTDRQTDGQTKSKDQRSLIKLDIHTYLQLLNFAPDIFLKIFGIFCRKYFGIKLFATITNMKFPAYDLAPHVSKFCLKEWQDIWDAYQGNKL